MSSARRSLAMMRRTALGVSIGWIGLSMVADGVPALLLPHRLLADGITDATTLGMTALIAIALAAVVQPFAGAWSDRIGRFPIVVLGTAVAGAGLALLLVAAGVVIGTVLALVGASIAQAGYQPLMPARVGERWRGRASGLKGAFDVAGAFVGFILIGAMLAAGSDLGAVAIVAAVLVSGFMAARLLLGRDEGRTPGTPSESASFETGERQALVAMIAARFLFLLGVYVVGRFLVLFMAERLGLGADDAAAQAGVAFAVLAGITVVASVPAGWLSDHVGRRPLLLLGGAIAAAGVALLTTAATSAEILLYGSLMAIGSAAFGSASWALLGDLVAGPAAGRLLGLANLGTAGAAAAAGVFGILIDARGFGPAFAIAAAACLLGGLVAWAIPASPWRPARLVDRVEAVG